MNSLTEHFDGSEVTHSETASRLGIDNSLPVELSLAVMKTAMGMEKIRAALGNLPISVSSWYRCPELNTRIGSKPSSQHTKGEAVDFTCPSFGSPLAICTLLSSQAALIRFDQLILEHTWVHVSFIGSIPGSKPRGQVLSLLKSGGYSTGLTNSDGVPYGNA